MNNVNTVIADALLGMNVTDQVGIDRVLLELDGTPTKSNLYHSPRLGFPLYRHIFSCLHHAIPMLHVLPWTLRTEPQHGPSPHIPE